jgi:hypothetical protein
MEKFINNYLDTNRKYRILDLGSQMVEGDETGSYKSLFKHGKNNWKYIGCDMVSGNNVDIVFKKPYDWKEIKSNSMDCVISGQVFEHVQFPWLTILEIRSILKPGGICWIIAPSSGEEHR